MKNLGNILYSIGAYAIFIFTLLWAMAFMANAWTPWPMDAIPRNPPGRAAAINMALVLLVVTQHCLLSRPGQARWWWALVPENQRRSTCLWVSATSVLVLMLLWQPDGRLVWNLDQPLAKSGVLAAYLLGCLLVMTNALLLVRYRPDQLGHAWKSLFSRWGTELEENSGFLPLSAGWLLVFWCVPSMTTSHFQFTVIGSAVVIYGLVERRMDANTRGGINSTQARWIVDEAIIPDDIQ